MYKSFRRADIEATASKNGQTNKIAVDSQTGRLRAADDDDGDDDD